MKVSTKKLVLNALMIALVFLITYLPFLHIPSPIAQGYFNIGDAAIMITALLLGKRSGFIAGAIGSALADLAYGAFIFVPITFIVKGLEGYIVGAIGYKMKNNKVSHGIRLLAVVAGAVTMAVGYFAFEALVLPLIDKSLAFTAIFSEIPGNLIQGAVGAILAYGFVMVMDKTNVIKKLG